MGEFQKRIKAFRNNTNRLRVFTDQEATMIQNSMILLVGEAKKEIFNAIEEHFQELVKAWRHPQKELEAFKDSYLDAYKCVKHNILNEDVFKLKKWFGKDGK